MTGRHYLLIGIAVVALTSCGTSRNVAVYEGNDDVVNLGFDSVSKKQNTYSVSSMKPDEKSMSGYSDIFEYMRGRVAGVQIGSAGPGQIPKITIRGENSINANREPLFIVDGMEVKDVMSVSPNDVYSIDVLKDGSAAMYGMRGAGGVILIKTKTAVEQQRAEQAQRKAELEAAKAARKAAKAAEKKN